MLIVYQLARLRYAPSVATSGLSPASIPGWLIAPPGSSPLANPSFDLAHLYGTDPPTLIVTAFLWSSAIVLLSCALTIAGGIPLGLWLGLRAPRAVAAIVLATTSFGLTLPAFFIALALQVAAVWLTARIHSTVVPVYGYGLDGHLVIPVIALSLAPFAYVTRMVALAASAAARADYVRTARAKGLPERVVTYRHIVATIAATLTARALGALRIMLGSLVIVEYLLAWPGIGLLTLRAANVQGVPVFIGCAIVIASLFLASELALDVGTHRRGAVSA